MVSTRRREQVPAVDKDTKGLKNKSNAASPAQGPKQGVHTVVAHAELEVTGLEGSLSMKSSRGGSNQGRGKKEVEQLEDEEIEAELELEEEDEEDEDEEGELDSFLMHPGLSEAMQSLQEHIAEPSVFLRPDPTVSAAARETSKVLYEYATRHLMWGTSRGEAREIRGGSAKLGANGLPPGLLPELYAGAGFDAEQIWLQLEVAATASLKRVRRLIAKADNNNGQGLSGAMSLIKPEYERDIAALVDGDDGTSSGDEGEDEDEGEEGDEDEGEFDEDEDEDEAMLKELLGKSGGSKKKRLKSSKADAGPLGPGEDRFMKFSEMEAFMLDAERNAAGEGDEALDENEDEDEDEDADEDLVMEGFEDGADDDDDDDDGDEEEDDLAALMKHSAKLAGKKGGKGAAKAAGRRDIMYQDFFGGGAANGKDGEEEADEGEDGDNEPAHAEEDEEEEDGDDDEDADGDQQDGDDDDGGDEEDVKGSKPSATKGAKSKEEKEALAAMSSHERRMARLQERISELESTAMGDKMWHLSGEADAARRPKNSALAIDMDFDTTVKPPPMPTEEVMADLETMIKARIADHKFDDVVHIATAQPERHKKTVALDEEKSKKGLGEMYEDDYVRAAVGGVAEDKDEKIRVEARALFQSLVVKLDALTHFNFSPKPVVEDMSVKSEVAAILMEEAAPVAVSKASLQLPGEVYKAQAKGKLVAEEELSREERKQRRAHRKRTSKAAKAQKTADQKLRPTTEGGSAPLTGRKSVTAAVGKKGAAAAAQVGTKHARSDFGKSTAVFARLQEQQEQAKAGIVPPKPGSKKVSATSAAAFKL